MRDCPVQWAHDAAGQPAKRLDARPRNPTISPSYGEILHNLSRLENTRFAETGDSFFFYVHRQGEAFDLIFFIAHKENEAHEIAGCEHETSRWCNHALHIRTVTSVIEDTGVYEGRQFPASRVDISAPRCTRRRCRGSRVGGYRRPRYRLLPMLCGFRNLCQS